MEHPLISFIIPCYGNWADNNPTLLERCLSSIHALHPSFTKEGEEWCQIILSKEGDDLSSSRNIALDKAQGEYIQFVDADDYLFSSYSEIIRILESERPDIVMFNTKECKCSGCDYMISHNLHGSACGYVFRKDLLGTLRFTPSIFHEDEEFTPQLIIKAQKLIGTPLMPYCYVNTSNSIMTCHEEGHLTKRLNDMMLVLMNLKDERRERKDESVHCSGVESKEHQALTRRVSQLTMDYLYNIFRLRRSELRARISDLRHLDLYPLPLHRYTWKYLFFALCTRFYS